MADCPKCGHPLSGVDGEHMPVFTGMQQWNGIAYSCPACNVLLSVEIDPIALKADIVAEVTAVVRRWLGWWLR
jgi:hypothetical protein